MNGTVEAVDSFDIGQRIQKLRKECGYTQMDLADMAGISISFYGNIERGRKMMSMETFIKICTALNASADYILSGKIPCNDAVIMSIMESAKRGGEEQYSLFLEVVKKFAYME